MFPSMIRIAACRSSVIRPANSFDQAAPVGTVGRMLKYLTSLPQTPPLPDPLPD